MSFDVDQLVVFAKGEIQKFSNSHKEETFYAFSIDASHLCLNSEQAFEKTLVQYQKFSAQHYAVAANIKELRMNTGDWAYMGFANFSKCIGFDNALYNEHYNLGLDLEIGQKALEKTEYAVAMDKVIERLVHDRAFESLNVTSDFRAARVEHNY